MDGINLQVTNATQDLEILIDAELKFHAHTTATSCWALSGSLL